MPALVGRSEINAKKPQTSYGISPFQIMFFFEKQQDECKAKEVVVFSTCFHANPRAVVQEMRYFSSSNALARRKLSLCFSHYQRALIEL